MLADNCGLTRSAVHHGSKGNTGTVPRNGEDATKAGDMESDMSSIQRIHDSRATAEQLLYDQWLQGRLCRSSLTFLPINSPALATEEHMALALAALATTAASPADSSHAIPDVATSQQQQQHPTTAHAPRRTLQVISATFDNHIAVYSAFCVQHAFITLIQCTLVLRCILH